MLDSWITCEYVMQTCKGVTSSTIHNFDLFKTALKLTFVPIPVLLLLVLMYDVLVLVIRWWWGPLIELVSRC